MRCPISWRPASLLEFVDSTPPDSASDVRRPIICARRSDLSIRFGAVLPVHRWRQVPEKRQGNGQASFPAAAGMFG
eukprot:3877574-Pyramimonas_sp.AAC.1